MSVSASEVGRPERRPVANPVRRRARRIDGVVLLDKPLGMSSNHAMLAVRRLLSAAKAGHGGTLDPMASGLLPVLLGEATKFAGDALDSDKTYLATLRLGELSSTADAEGEITPTGHPLPDLSQVESALARFRGTIEQVPPMHSALKHAGRPLYELARQGANVERAPRTITIHTLTRVALEGARLTIRVVCSKGTYIRVLAQDIGDALGCGAWLSDLRREGAAGLSLDHGSVTLDALAQMSELERDQCVQPADRLLDGLNRIDLPPEWAPRFLSGQRLRLAAPVRADRADIEQSSTLDICRVRVYGSRDSQSSSPVLLGLAHLHDGLLIPLRLISTQDQDSP